MERLYIGWTATPVNLHLLEPPKAPTNYKDPKLIEQFIAQALVKQQEQAKLIPGVAALQEVVVLSEAGEQVFSCQGQAWSQVATAFYDFLSTAASGLGWSVSRQRGRPWLAAQQAQLLGRILGYELLSINKHHVALPLHLLIREEPDMHLWLDPFRYLVPAELQTHLNWTQLLQLWFEESTGAIPTLDTAAERAATTWRLCQRAKL